MIRSLWATIRGGKIEPAEQVDLPEGMRVLVTLLPDEDADFWSSASQESLAAVWDNTEDDVYAELLGR